MTRYSLEFKEQIVRKMMPPNAQSVAQIGRECGISTPTLYAWRNQYKAKGHVVPANSSNPEQWSGQDKLAVIVETASLNTQELSEYCRHKGLYPEQIQRWKEAATDGVERGVGVQHDKSLIPAERKRIKQLEKELRRKEKALAEAAALLVLSKKAQAIWGEKEDE